MPCSCIPFIFLSFVLLFDLSATIVKTSSWKEIAAELKKLDKKGLAVFDIDYTLIVPNDGILKPCGQKYLIDYFSRFQEQANNWEILTSKILLQGKVSLADKRVLTIFESLRKRKIKTIALTAMSPGPFGLIPEMEEWRVGQLKSVGIQFDWSFPAKDTVILKLAENERRLSTYKKGIIASGFTPKGDALVSFLKEFGFNPSKVIFVDDNIRFIQSVEKELDKLGIPLISFHYTGLIESSCSLDETIAEFQLNHLLEKGEWLSEGEALKKLN